MERLSLEEGYGEMESAFLEGATPHPRAMESPYWDTPRRRGEDNTSRTGPGEGRLRPGGGDRTWRDLHESRQIPRGSRKDHGSYYETPGGPTDPWDQHEEHRGERIMSSELRGRQRPYRVMESGGVRPRRGPDGPGNFFYDRGERYRDREYAEQGDRERYTEGYQRGYNTDRTYLGRVPQRNQGRAGQEEGSRAKGSPMPKTLKYDGKTNWQAFYAKFARYAEVVAWTPEECRDQLCWCLDGKASEFYALLVERNQDLAYPDLVRKLEKRFGFKELPETAQVQFNNARQLPEESLEDWADRVLSLATRAFRHLPEEHMYKQAVLRLCQGAADKEAGSYASNVRPQSMEDAVDKIRWYQHNQQAIYGKPRREVRYVSPEGRGDMRVCATTRQEYSGGSPWTNDLKSLEARVEAKVEGLEGKMTQGFKELTQLLTSQRAENRPASRSSSPRGAREGCYHCGSSSHFKRDCPKLAHARSPSPTGAACFHCGASTHLKRDCPKLAGSRSPSPAGTACYHCGGLGHLRRDCPKLGRPTSPKPVERRVSFQTDTGRSLNSNGSALEV